MTALTPGLSWACACGCGIFDVGTPSLIPKGVGGTVWLEYDFMDQYINWQRPTILRRRITTISKSKHTLRRRWSVLFNPSWGVMATVPYTIRLFSTQGGGNDITITITPTLATCVFGGCTPVYRRTCRSDYWRESSPQPVIILITTSIVTPPLEPEARTFC